VIVASATFIIGSLLLRETKNVLIWEEVETTPGADDAAGLTPDVYREFVGGGLNPCYAGRPRCR
jgi:hypothetical protein